MSRVVLDTVDVKTDAFAGLYLDKVTFTTVTLSWRNVSKFASDFRIVLVGSGSSSLQEYPSVNVSSGATDSFTVTNLSPGNTYNFYLERYEIDTWIRQTSTSSTIDYVQATTFSLGLTLSTSSTSVLATWTNPIQGQRYFVTCLDLVSEKSKELSKISDAMMTTTGDRPGGKFITVDDKTANVIFSDLTQGQTYFMTVYVMETANQAISLSSQKFETSAAAAMEIVEGPMASYIVLDWTKSVDGKGSNYRIVNRTNGSDTNGSDTILAESSTDTLATIRNLTPGESYKFVLQRLELDKTWDDQTEVVTTALTSSMSVSSVGSTTLEVSWTPIVAGSEYEVIYSSGLGYSTISGSGRTTDLRTILRGLSPGTPYKLDLVTYELGGTVGIASLGLSTDRSFTQKYAIIGVVITILVLFVVAKLKSR